MNKTDLRTLLKLLITPMILMLLGLVLIFSPDSAAALLVRVLGWILVVIGIGFGVSAVAVPGNLVAKVLGAVSFILVGAWMIANPLILAAWVGRLAGLLLMIQGIQDLLYLRCRIGSVLLPILTTVLGGVLVLLPMTTSRLVFVLIGIAVLVMGILMLLERLRGWKQFREPDDPNIIDAL